MPHLPDSQVFKPFGVSSYWIFPVINRLTGVRAQSAHLNTTVVPEDFSCLGMRPGVWLLSHSPRHFASILLQIRNSSAQLIGVRSLNSPHL